MASTRALQSLLKRCTRNYSAPNLKVKVPQGFAMSKPHLYGSSNEIQKKCTIHYFKEFEHKIKWNKNGDTAIDLGCGDGSVTVAVKNAAPCNFKTFIATDYNEAMVEYANQRYADENTLFRVLDIVQDMPKDLIGAFNHVFSFYALQWVKDQEKAFKNIHELLTREGDCFLTFLATTGIYDVYNVLSQHPKWKTWLKDVDLFISPYYNMEKPEKRVKEIMTKSGFKNVEVQCNKMTSIQDSLQDLKTQIRPLLGSSLLYNRIEIDLYYIIDVISYWSDIVQAVEPFNMPEEVFQEFYEDYKRAGQETGVLHIDRNANNEVTSVKYDYAMLVCYGQK